MGDAQGTESSQFHRHQGAVDEELWDVIYYAIAIANLCDTGLEAVIQAKTKLNETRCPLDVVFEENRIRGGNDGDYSRENHRQEYFGALFRT